MSVPCRGNEGNGVACNAMRSGSEGCCAVLPAPCWKRAGRGCFCPHLRCILAQDASCARGTFRSIGNCKSHQCSIFSCVLDPPIALTGFTLRTQRAGHSLVASGPTALGFRGLAVSSPADLWLLLLVAPHSPPATGNP